jgi:hypothetical protein
VAQLLSRLAGVQAGQAVLEELLLQELVALAALAEQKAAVAQVDILVPVVPE